MKKLLSTLALVASIAAPVATNAQTTVAVKTGDLIKGSLSTVYYLYDGQRLVFPTEKTYKTWYTDYKTVKTIPDSQLMTYTLKANVTYRPGKRLVKITTDPKVYAIASGGMLRPIASEAVAKLVFGNDWSKQIDDIPDAFFINYKIGEPIDSNDDFNPTTEADKASSIWKDKGYATPADY
jgi:hypothetical protein